MKFLNDVILTGAGADLTAPATVTFSGLSATTETNAVVVNSSGVLSKRALGSNAFNSTTIPTGVVFTTGNQTIAGVKTFSDNLTAGANSLTAGSLDINGNADISGSITSASGSFHTTGTHFQLNTPSGYIQMGAMNTSHAHVYTDRPDFYFNKAISINGANVLTAVPDDYFREDDIVMNENPFGGRSLYNSQSNNPWFLATDRYTVTQTGGSSIANAFNGDYESSYLVAANGTATFNIDFGQHPGYPYGWIYLSFYYVNQPSAVSGRVYNNYAPHTVGWSALTFTDVVNTSSQRIIKARQGKYGLTDLEITLTAPAGTTVKLTACEIHLDRPGTQEMPVLNKFRPETLYKNLTVNAAITATGKIQGAELEGTSLDINGNADISGNLTGVDAFTASGKIQGAELEGTSLDINGNADISGNLTGVDAFTASGKIQGAELEGTSLDINGRVDLQTISTSGDGTVIRGGFLNPAAEASMVHIPHLINDLAGFQKWSNSTITVTGLYKTRSGSSGSYTYSNAVTESDFSGGQAFDAHSSTAGSWYSNNGADGSTAGVGVITLEWPNELTYSAWAGIVFGSGSFTAPRVKIEAYRGGAWQTLCNITDNNQNVVLRQIASNSGTNNATTKLRYTLGGSVNGSYFRIHTLYAANYRAGDNSLNNTSTAHTQGVNFLERYKDGYLHGSLYPGADDTYDLGSNSYQWRDGYFDGSVICDGVTVDGNIAVNGTVDGIDIATDVAANTLKTSNIVQTTVTGNAGTATALTSGNKSIGGTLTVTSASDGILNLRQSDAGSTAGTKEGGWNYIQFQDGQGDRQAYFGIDSAGNLLFAPEVASKKVKTNTGLIVNGDLDANNLALSAGSIVLSGTGRIQGIDTVTLGTDAANKTYVDNAVIANTDTQDLSISGQTLSLTNGGSVTLPDTNTQLTLNNTNTSTSTTEAATANSAKLAYDRGSLGVTNAASAQTTANAALPKAGGEMTGALTINLNGDALNLRSTTNGQPANITFSTNVPDSQIGHIKYSHSNSASYGGGDSFTIGGTETTTVILADGQLMYKDGIYSKPASGTGAGTRKDASWDTAYTHSQTDHAPANATANSSNATLLARGNHTGTQAYSTITGTPTIPSGNAILDWTTDRGTTNIHTGNYINTTYNKASSTVLGLVKVGSGLAISSAGVLSVGQAAEADEESGGAMSSEDKTKLNAIEAEADVTDATNVAAAGASMKSATETISGAKTFSSTIAGSINGNSATTSERTITGGEISAISTNTSKVGITTGQTSAITANTAKNTSSNLYGSTIKLIPSDFATNDHGGNTKHGIAYVDTAGGSYGMKVASPDAELIAFVSIPEGMKATHVNIYAKGTYATTVYEVQINATTMVSKGTGNCNTNLDITDVNATATNFLAIVINTIATTNKVYGGVVTIAAI